MLERLGEIVNGDDALVRRGRYFSDTFMLEVGETQYLIEIRQGRVESVATGPFVMRSWTFAIRATENVWQRFWENCRHPAITISSRFCARAVSRSTASCSR